MDAQTGLSLGLNTSMPSPTAPSTTPLTDNSSSSFQVNSTPSFSWRLHDKPDKVLLKSKEQKQEEYEQEGETIDFMSSPPVCLKRQMEEQQQQQCFPSKCVAVDWGNQPLSVADPEIHTIMEKEKLRQFKGIELIASKNFVCKAVMEALGSHLTNKYSEGMPGAKYYTGNQYIDQLEFLCCERALLAFNLDPNNT